MSASGRDVGVDGYLGPPCPRVDRRSVDRGLGYALFCLLSLSWYQFLFVFCLARTFAKRLPCLNVFHSNESMFFEPYKSMQRRLIVGRDHEPELDLLFPCGSLVASKQDRQCRHFFPNLAHRFPIYRYTWTAVKPLDAFEECCALSRWIQIGGALSQKGELLTQATAWSGSPLQSRLQSAR